MQESILPQGVVKVASILADWPALQSYYLAGGTALALQRGHRRSRDLDFFTKQAVSHLPLATGSPTASEFGEIQWVMKEPDQIHWRLDGVSVTLLAYPFSHDFPFHPWRGLDIADARDIAVQKAYTLGRRAHARDYLDLHEVLTGGVMTLEELIARTQRTYGDGFSPRLFLQQLTYTRDLPDRDDALSLLTVPQSFDRIEHDLHLLVHRWMQEHLAPPKPKGSPS